MFFSIFPTNVSNMSATRGAKVIHAFDATFNDYALAISFTNDRPLEKKNPFDRSSQKNKLRI